MKEKRTSEMELAKCETATTEPERMRYLIPATTY